MTRGAALALAVIIAAGTALRLAPIGWGLPSRSLAFGTYSPDEQDSFHSLEQMNPRKLDFYPRWSLDWGSVHIYTLGAALKTAQVAGLIKVGNRDFYLKNPKELDRLYVIARLISTVSAAVSLWLICLLVLRVFGSAPLALFCSALLAVVPVHLATSLYSRADVLMVMFGLAATLLSLRVLERGSRRDYVLCGVLTGVTIAAKYSGGAFLAAPLLAHTIRLAAAGELTFRKFFDGNLLRGAAAVLAAFACASPYTVSPAFAPNLRHLLSVAQNSSYDGPAWLQYIVKLLPLGMGWPLFVSAAAGGALLLADWRKDRDPRKLFIVLAGLGVYGIITRPRYQLIMYTLPLIPFLAVYAAYLYRALWTARAPAARLAGRAAVLLSLGYTLAYSLAYWNLFRGTNVREEASDWISANIPAGAAVGIAKHYYWTPPVLRQKEPPYKLLLGAGMTSSLPDAVGGLKNVEKEAEYIVLSEYEYRDFLRPEARERYPEQAAVIEDLFSGKKFVKAAVFDKEASFLGLKFRKRYPPGDWLFPNPEITVFRRV